MAEAGQFAQEAPETIEFGYGHTLPEAFADLHASIARVLTGHRTPDCEQNDVTIYGTLGLAGLHSSIDMNQAGAFAVRTNALTEDEAYLEHPFALYKKQVQAFDAAVEGNGKPLATGIDGLRVVEITLAREDSSRTGSRVSLG